MAIYKKGQELKITLVLDAKILRAFAVNDTIYYIVWVPQSNVANTEKAPQYGVFRHDDTVGPIPVEVMEYAEYLVQKENLLEGLG